jgi:hypothetical protein
MLAVAIMQMTPTTSCIQRVFEEVIGAGFDIDDVTLLILHSLLGAPCRGLFDWQ